MRPPHKMMNSTLQLGALLTTLWAGTAVSCSGSPPELSPEPSSAATPARVLSQHGSATPRPPGAVPSVPASPPASTPAPVAPATYQATTITRVLAEPVHALGVDGQYGALGALGGDAWMTTRFKEGQERTWRKLPFPKHLRPAADEKDEARIYFGRDNQPRVMGTRFGPDGPRQHYLRFRHGRWKTEPHELAAFAGRPHAALYGWLGWDDPEVLCKVGRFCLLKSRRGWSQAPLVVPSPGVALRVDYGADGPFALTDTQVLVLDGKRWRALGGDGPWSAQPTGAFTRGNRAWVSVASENALYHFDGVSWQKHTAPVSAPAGLWSDRPGRVWIAANGGAGVVDGQHSQRVDRIEGPLAAVIGHRGRVWLGGASGVWRVTP